MRVALVTNRFPSASETFIYNHAVGLRAAGIDVTVVAAARSDDEALFSGNGRAFDGPVVYQALQRNLVATARELARSLRSSGPHLDVWDHARRRYGAGKRAIRAWLLAAPLVGFDIVHFEYSGLAVTQLDALPLIQPARIVASCRGTAERIMPVLHEERRARLREIFAICDRVHCVSDEMQRTCERYGLDPAKAFVNRPAIDATRFRRAVPYRVRERGPFRLLSTGRLHWPKGIEYGLVAVRHLLDAGHDVHYEIVGSGDEEDRLRFAVADMRLDAHVTFAGKRSATEVRDALERADVYVLPSISEGISNAALEAMAMEVPIVGTTAGGMTEAVTDGVEGLLVSPRDGRALADRIARLLVDGAARAAMGSAGRRRVEREFSLDFQIRTYVTEYASLLTRAAA